MTIQNSECFSVRVKCSRDQRVKVKEIADQISFETKLI